METKTKQNKAAVKQSHENKIAKQRKKKKNKDKHKGTKDVNHNHTALMFIRKLSQYLRAQETGVLPSDIPFKWSSFFKGTQIPTIRLYLISSLVATSNGVAQTTTLQVSASQFSHFSDLAAVFDEYRPIGGDIEFVPNAGPLFTNAATHQANLQTSVGVIDYDNTTALASFDEGLEYDTKKKFFMCATPSKQLVSTSWRMQFEKLPDQQWVDCATNSTVFCTWKMYANAADIAFSNSRAFYLMGWMDIQFRGSG